MGDDEEGGHARPLDQLPQKKSRSSLVPSRQYICTGVRLPAPASIALSAAMHAFAAFTYEEHTPALAAPTQAT
jgi:hypothetical protein